MNQNSEENMISNKEEEMNQVEKHQTFQFSVNTYAFIRKKQFFQVSQIAMKMFDDMIYVGNATKDKHIIMNIIDSKTSQKIGHISHSDTGAFCLYSNDSSLFANAIISYSSTSDAPRIWNVSFLKGTETFPKTEVELKSRLPTKTSKGQYILFFGGRLAIPSIKNCTLIQQNTKEEVIGIRKTDKDIIEVDARNDYTPIQIFFLGAIAFLSK